MGFLHTIVVSPSACTGLNQIYTMKHENDRAQGTMVQVSIGVRHDRDSMISQPFCYCSSRLVV